MPTNPNMVAIQTVTVGSGGAASIEFTSIPQTYTDLAIVLSARTNRTSPGSAMNDGALMTFNSSATSYSNRALEGNGASASSFTGATTSIDLIQVTTDNVTASTFGNTLIYIPNYTSSNNKSVSIDYVTENNATTALAGFTAALWSNSAAITSIKFVPQVGTLFKQYSTATLYGVTSAAYGAKATGGIITSDANYYYHTFLASGTFTPTSNITADYLVVAGGGGGGASGGGAGGLRCTVGATGGGGSVESPLSLTASTAYTVTVGAGGAGSTNGQSANGSDGNNSVFSSITSTGGGGGINGGAPQLNNGRSGGSGSGGYAGGDNSSIGSTATGGAGTTNQGYAGGSSAAKAINTSSSGGGGGAGAVGGNAPSTDSAGAGGNGVSTSISGISATYAGGGGGGTYVNGTAKSGGTGGGGTGSTGNAAGSSGTANTGGGGGGAYSEAYKTAAYAGGSGIVIVRYSK